MTCKCRECGLTSSDTSLFERPTHCKQCRNRYLRKQRRIHRAPRNYAAEQEAVMRYRGKNRHRVSAWNAVSYALRHGNLVRPDKCSKCGQVGPVEAHHEDYTKPLEVQWLCTMCHRLEDGRAQKEAA